MLKKSKEFEIFTLLQYNYNRSRFATVGGGFYSKYSVFSFSTTLTSFYKNEIE